MVSFTHPPASHLCSTLFLIPSFSLPFSTGPMNLMMMGTSAFAAAAAAAAAAVAADAYFHPADTVGE